jgi:hypothetical protein
MIMSTHYAHKYSENTQENCLLEFLDTYVYKTLYENYEFTQDKCFLIPQVPEKHMIKGQLSKSTINKPKDSFAMDVLSEDKPGWLIDPNDANIIVLAFIKKAQVNSYGYMKSGNDIEELELLFIDKRDLKAHINTSIYDEAMYETAQKMCKQNTRSILVSHDMYLYNTDATANKSVCLVVKKYTLDDLAFARLIATKNSIQSI